MAPRRRRPRLLSPAFMVRQKAFSEGVIGSSRVWRGVAAVMFGMSLVRRLAGRRPEIVATEVLRPGQFVRVEALGPRGGRRARRRRR